MPRSTPPREAGGVTSYGLGVAPGYGERVRAQFKESSRGSERFRAPRLPRPAVVILTAGRRVRVWRIAERCSQMEPPTYSGFIAVPPGDVGGDSAGIKQKPQDTPHVFRVRHWP